MCVELSCALWWLPCSVAVPRIFISVRSSLSGVNTRTTTNSLAALPLFDEGFSWVVWEVSNRVDDVPSRAAISVQCKRDQSHAVLWVQCSVSPSACLVIIATVWLCAVCLERLCGYVRPLWQLSCVAESILISSIWESTQYFGSFVFYNRSYFDPLKARTNLNST